MCFNSWTTTTFEILPLLCWPFNKGQQPSNKGQLPSKGLWREESLASHIRARGSGSRSCQGCKSGVKSDRWWSGSSLPSSSLEVGRHLQHRLRCLRCKFARSMATHLDVVSSRQDHKTHAHTTFGADRSPGIRKSSAIPTACPSRDKATATCAAEGSRVHVTTPWLATNVQVMCPRASSFDQARNLALFIVYMPRGLTTESNKTDPTTATTRTGAVISTSILTKPLGNGAGSCNDPLKHLWASPDELDRPGYLQLSTRLAARVANASTNLCLVTGRSAQLPSHAVFVTTAESAHQLQPVQRASRVASSSAPVRASGFA